MNGYGPTETTISCTIEENLETFRAKIYFKSKVEPIERIPVTVRMINFKDTTEESNR